MFLAAFIVIIILMIVAISVLHIHPFLSILGAAAILGFLCLDPVTTLDTMLSGFSGVFETIGLIVIFGTLIGMVLETTGAALKISDVIVRLFGPRRPDASLGVTGWLASISVFCDSGFVILNPVRKAIVKRLQSSSVASSVSLALGLFISHSLVPPCPGPVAAAGMLNIEDKMLFIIGFGVIASIPALIASCFFARFIGKRIKDKVEAQSTQGDYVHSYEELLASYERLPSAFLSFLPILLPIVLMAISSFATMTGMNLPFLILLGKPTVAIAVGFLSSLLLLHRSGKINELYNLTNESLKTAGTIMFITASGSALGKIIGASPLIPFFTEHASTLTAMGVFFPYLFAALLKTSQGSSTVAITTTAGVVAPMLSQLGFDDPARTALVVTAIGCGALTVSHVNDSLFWIVMNFGQLRSTLDGYKTHVLGTAIAGGASILTVFVISLFL